MNIMWFIIGVVAGSCLGIIVAGVLNACDDGSSEIKEKGRWWDDV